jgi:predicted permease
MSMFHWLDVRYALRLLRRSPAFTALTVIVLGGGLALSIFTFSFLHAAMVRPLPLSGGERLVRVEPASGSVPGTIDAAELALVRPGVTTLRDLGAFTRRELILGSEGRRRVIGATAAEWNIFEHTRTPPAIGRTFRAGDAAPGAEPVIVLAHRTWEVAFGGDSGIVGRTVALDGTMTRVIGVMPEGYGFPVAAAAWVPLGAETLRAPVPRTLYLDVYGRLAPGASASEARRELEVLFTRARASLPRRADEPPAAPVHLDVRSFPMAQIGDEAPLVFGLLNLLASLILMLACIDVVNLLLARANERSRETAVRLALGASRGRLVMQGMWESVLLSLSGGVLATVLAAWGLDAINAWTHSRLADNLAFWWVWGFDRTTLLAAGAFVTATIAVLGGVVAARTTRMRVNEALQDGGTRAGARAEGRIARALVATQIATVSVLMFFGVMSGIVAWQAAHVEFGYDTRHLLAASVDLPADRYETPERRAAFFRALDTRLAQWREIDGAVLRTRLADDGTAEGEIEIGDGRPVPPAGTRPRAYVRGVLGPLTALGMSLGEGRLLDASDRRDGPPVAVVSRAFAARHWPTRSAVGQRVRLSGLGERDEWRTVVGVVSDVVLGNPLSRERSTEAVYVPLAQSDAASVSIMFRHRGDEGGARAALNQSIAAIDPTLPPPDVSTYDEILEKSALIARSVAKLFAACFGFALLLAVCGTYGLMARAIGRRTREIGVRRALGATDGDIVRLLMGQGGRQLGIGAVVALPAMLLVGAGFAHYVPIALALAAATGLAVTATIVAVVLAATYVPTRRALAVAPRDALWRE